MSVSVNLPPNSRDFLAFQRIVIDQASTRQVSRDLGISQTRVRQIVGRVTDWLQQNLPVPDEKQQAARLQLAQHIAADRLDRYLHEADHSWQLTQETKYANLALRLLTTQSKFPVFAGTLEALAADAILGPLPDEELTTQTRSVSEGTPVPNADHTPPSDPAQAAIQNPKSKIQNAVSPPIEDCSLHSPLAPSPSENPAATADANPLAPGPCDQLPQTNRAARNAFLSPAHLLLKAEDAPVAELKITPQSFGFTANKNLSRKDRRRMRRLALAK